MMNNDYFTEFFVEHIGSGLGSRKSGSGCRTDPDPQPWFCGSVSGSYPELLEPFGSDLFWPNNMLCSAFFSLKYGKNLSLLHIHYITYFL